MENIRDTHKKLREELKSRIEMKRSWEDKLADFLTGQFGSVWFLNVHAVLFFSWIIFNLGLVWGIAVFDPYPFNLLTMVVSLEAIFLSTIVLISQNRQSRIADMREQIDVEIDVRAEDEITKLLVMIEAIAHKLEIPLADDPELKRMEERTDIGKIRERIERDNGNE